LQTQETFKMIVFTRLRKCFDFLRLLANVLVHRDCEMVEFLARKTFDFVPLRVAYGWHSEQLFINEQDEVHLRCRVVLQQLSTLAETSKLVVTTHFMTSSLLYDYSKYCLIDNQILLQSLK